MTNEHHEHYQQVDQVLVARTEQLRQALTQKQQLLESLRQLQSLESLQQIKEALQSTIEKFADPPMQVPKFGGNPGEPVPEVDPEDLKALWQLQKEVEVQHPGQQVAIGSELAKRCCKPGADIQAVGYRVSFLWLMTRIAPEQFATSMKDGEPIEAAFRAAAKVPAEWMGVGIVRQRPPFDMKEFLRLCAEQ